MKTALQGRALENGSIIPQTTVPPAPASTCPLCGKQHDETVSLLMKAEYRRILDDDLAAERAYVERELIEINDPELEVGLTHRLAVLKDEEGRRRRLASRGGPLYKGRASISKERIARVKDGLDIADLIARDLDIAWMRGDRTWFFCPAHGDGHDRNPSLVAYESQGRWWCYGCNSGGDGIDWLIAKRGLSFREAVEELERCPAIS